MVLGCEDMENAYRSVPCLPEHYPFCVIGIFHPSRRCMVFAIEYALLFGQTAAVNNFNRVPAFLTALSCRIFKSACWHFFDDFAVIEAETRATLKCSGQECLKFAASAVGIPMGNEKAKAPSSDQVYLGITNKFSRMKDGYLQLVPTPERIEKISSKLSSFLSDNYIDEDDLNSIRGDIVFLSCTSFSKSIRGGLGF